MLIIHPVFMTWIGLLFFTEGVDGSICDVTPVDKAVSLGESISLTCFNTTERYLPDEWIFIDMSGSSARIYKETYYDPAQTKLIPKYLKEGYSLDDSVIGRRILTINETNPAHAGAYRCECTPVEANSAPREKAVSNIVLLESPARFSDNVSVTDGDPLNFSCSLTFRGSANCSISIRSSSGDTLAVGSGHALSNMSTSCSVNYSVASSASIKQSYFCSVTLTNSSSNANFYTKQLNTTVMYPVQNVWLSFQYQRTCSDNQQCSNYANVHCAAEGNPLPGRFSWKVWLSGSEYNRNIPNTGPLLKLTDVGEYVIECTAFNSIKGKEYNSSGSLNITVTLEELTKQEVKSDQKIPLIVGLVVGLGGGLLIIVAIAVIAIILYKRKKNQTHKPTAYTSCTPDTRHQEVYTELNISPTYAQTIDRTASGRYDSSTAEYENVIPT